MTFQTVARQQIAVVALWVVPAVLGGRDLLSQTPVTGATNLVQQQKTGAKPVQPLQPAPEAIAAPPPAAPVPMWLANQPPNRARVSWNIRGVEIEASNSSLNQILRQVAADAGARLEGLSEDQRVFGSYGPGPARDVLLKLLDGSGYNVLMIGGRDADVPREIVLSARSPASPLTNANTQDRSSAEDQPKPEPPPDIAAQPDQNPFALGEPPRDPGEIMQEILDRQHKLDEQQQEQQNNPPQ